ncbi:MAG: hypothetical protein HYW26_04885 [Candidatus Aenigmarchaeota archaeon]|nr:hypothetical protein [Candidatus Aenigmarchaeota archaeon]
MLLEKLFSKKEKKIIHVLTLKPKARKRNYNVWKCDNCGDEYYFRPIKCPVCASDVHLVKRSTTVMESPVTKYLAE